MSRAAVPLDVQRKVLHVSGYMCANPICRRVVTLEIHHAVPVAEDGPNTADNLIVLCPNCHSLVHKTGGISQESIRTWHHLLLALNEAFPRDAIDCLLMLNKIGKVFVPGDGLLRCAGLIASGLVDARTELRPGGLVFYNLSLSDKGSSFVNGWIEGDEKKAVIHEASAFAMVEVTAMANAIVVRPEE